MLSLLFQLALILPSRSRRDGAEAIVLDSTLQYNVLVACAVFFNCGLFLQSTLTVQFNCLYIVERRIEQNIGLRFFYLEPGWLKIHGPGPSLIIIMVWFVTPFPANWSFQIGTCELVLGHKQENQPFTKSRPLTEPDPVSSHCTGKETRGNGFCLLECERLEPGRPKQLEGACIWAPESDNGGHYIGKISPSETSSLTFQKQNLQRLHASFSTRQLSQAVRWFTATSMRSDDNVN